MAAVIPDRHWIAVQLDRKWTVRCEHDPIEPPGYAGMMKSTRRLVKLLNQVGVR